MSIVEQGQSPKQSLSVLAERTGGLYSLPGVAMEVLELTKDPEVDAHKLKACIERDAALTVRLLRVVNSSLFGLSREVSDLGQAVAILGAKPLQLLVLGFSLPDALFTGLAQEALASYWHTTLCKAVAARSIGDRYFNGRGDEGLIVGLLQDVGLLVLLQQLQRPFIEFVEKAKEAGVDLLAAEEKSLGFDHTQLSRRMLDQWQLPESIACAVEADPADLNDFSPKALTLHKIVTAAGKLAKVVVDKRADTLHELLQSEPFRTVPFEQLRALVVDLREQVEQLADVLNLSWSGELDFETMLLDSQAQLASSSEDVLVNLLRAREEALSAQYDTSQLWSAFGKKRQPSAKAPAPAKADHLATKAPQTARPAAQPQHAVGEPQLTRELDYALATAISACRQERTATSLIVVSVDHYQSLNPGTLDPADELERSFRVAGGKMQHEFLQCVTVADNAFAFVVPHCERSGAVRDGHRVLDDVRQLLMARHGSAAAQVKLACGVATVALAHKHFQGSELFHAACRCLTAAQLAGGDSVKSIEIY